MVIKCNSVTKWFTKFNFVNEMITKCNFVDEMVTKCNCVHEIIYRIQFRTQNAISWTKWFTEFNSVHKLQFRARNSYPKKNSWTKWFTEFNFVTKWFTEFNSVHEMVTKCNSVHEMNFVVHFVTKLCKFVRNFQANTWRSISYGQCPGREIIFPTAVPDPQYILPHQTLTISSFGYLLWRNKRHCYPFYYSKKKSQQEDLNSQPWEQAV